MKQSCGSFPHCGIVGLRRMSKRLYPSQVRMLNGYSLALSILELAIVLCYDGTSNGRNIFKLFSDCYVSDTKVSHSLYC
jgi:hypothetical protein